MFWSPIPLIMTISISVDPIYNGNPYAGDLVVLHQNGMFYNIKHERINYSFKSFPFKTVKTQKKNEFFE